MKRWLFANVKPLKLKAIWTMELAHFFDAIVESGEPKELTSQQNNVCSW